MCPVPGISGYSHTRYTINPTLQINSRLFVFDIYERTTMHHTSTVAATNHYLYRHHRTTSNEHQAPSTVALFLLSCLLAFFHPSPSCGKASSLPTHPPPSPAAAVALLSYVIRNLESGGDLPHRSHGIRGKPCCQCPCKTPRRSV